MSFDLHTEPAVYILHENDEWMPPLARALEAEGVPFVTWKLGDGSIDLTQAPPEGIFWSRLSASSPSRGHATAKETARAILRWAEAAGRRVVNGSGVVEFEVSKVAQYVALAAAGFDVPRTAAVFGSGELTERARSFATPFITKHNQGGKGLGVRRFDTHDEFDAAVAAGELEEPVDGITLLQEHIVAAEPFVTRAEFVGGRLVYAVRVDTSAGTFELCPADACAVPGDESTLGGAAPSLFSRRVEVTDETPIIARLGVFLAENGIEVAGVEYFETADGRVVPYDINTNTNYSPDVEAAWENLGARTVARFVGDELARRYAPVAGR